MTPRAAKTLIHAGAEVAVLDVGERGQYGDGHLLFASNCPYSRLELLAPRLVPNRRTFCLLCDAGDGISERAAKRLASIGYRNVAILQGGAPAWRGAGFVLFKGVNVPSKILGELTRTTCSTPTVTPDQLEVWRHQRRPVMLVDGRPFNEFAKMSIPDARCVPNGELLYRLPEIVSDKTTPIVITCAGRTRGLIGAQSLINAGVRNPVFALENGTQGWALSGRALDRGRIGRPLPVLAKHRSEGARGQAVQLAQRLAVPTIDAGELPLWLADEQHTLYLLDVRTAEEIRNATRCR